MGAGAEKETGKRIERRDSVGSCPAIPTTTAIILNEQGYSSSSRSASRRLRGLSRSSHSRSIEDNGRIVPATPSPRPPQFDRRQEEVIEEDFIPPPLQAWWAISRDSGLDRAVMLLPVHDEARRERIARLRNPTRASADAAGNCSWRKRVAARRFCRRECWPYQRRPPAPSSPALLTGCYHWHEAKDRDVAPTAWPYGKEKN